MTTDTDKLAATSPRACPACHASPRSVAYRPHATLGDRMVCLRCGAAVAIEKDEDDVRAPVLAWNVWCIRVQKILTRGAEEK